MFHTVPDPEVLPAVVARRSIAIDLYDTSADLGRAFPDIALPERLRHAVRKRHIEYLAGRWCAREAMRVGRGYQSHAVIATGEEREPLWPDGVVGSITHTQGFVSAAIADARVMRSLGVDSEETFTVERARRLAGHLARPGELEALARTGLDEGVIAAAVFSVKESVYKCLHPLVKTFFGFQAAEVVEISPEGAVRVRLTETLTREFREGYVLEGRVAITARHVHTAVSLSA